MIMETAKECKVIYQTPDSDCDLPEPAIVVNAYQHNITIDGESGFVSINRNTIPELIKVLKEYKNWLPK